MKFLAVIPARYASTRFPGKPLALIGDKPMIQHVYEQAKKAVEDVVVATDDKRIYDAVEAFGGKVLLTSDKHRSGTDRCFEALQKMSGEYDVVINIQGDEPFIQPEQIETLKACFTDPKTEIATLIKPFDKDALWDDLSSPNTPKVVINKRMEAMFFSRSVIPYLRGTDRTKWLKTHTYYKHIGLYAYKTNILAEITELEPSALEKAENLEQLRWLENGYSIKVGITHQQTIGVDTPEDLEKANYIFNKTKK
ncbi:MAG: 3-deoxy-manno-octulosonate cytidylyltransferase [Paludibacteraceae bacterium]|nr:3-deoxy-manno-octulosonate cytidylyltransferase [Paludibacteraceae bacterium]